MIRFFREQKLLAVLLMTSLLVIIAGAIMIQYSNSITEPAEAARQEQKAQVVVGAMTAVASMAGQELQNSQASEAKAIPVGDVIPQESLDHVAALNGRIPEVGSNDWCEVMMVKKASEWTKEEQDTFAKHCL